VRRERTESLKERHSDDSSMACDSSTRPHSCLARAHSSRAATHGLV
jgi:hypothetical protein